MPISDRRPQSGGYVSTSDTMVAQCSAPTSEPAKSAFLRLRAIGLMDRSTVLEAISIRPSPAAYFREDGCGWSSVLGGTQDAIPARSQSISTQKRHQTPVLQAWHRRRHYEGACVQPQISGRLEKWPSTKLKQHDKPGYPLLGRPFYLAIPPILFPS
jgi:hypothetical protein